MLCITLSQDHTTFVSSQPFLFLYLIQSNSSYLLLSYHHPYGASWLKQTHCQTPPSLQSKCLPILFATLTMPSPSTARGLGWGWTRRWQCSIAMITVSSHQLCGLASGMWLLYIIPLFLFYLLTFFSAIKDALEVSSSITQMALRSCTIWIKFIEPSMYVSSFLSYFFLLTTIQQIEHICIIVSDVWIGVVYKDSNTRPLHSCK